MIYRFIDKYAFVSSSRIFFFITCLTKCAMVFCLCKNFQWKSISCSLDVSEKNIGIKDIFPALLLLSNYFAWAPYLARFQYYWMVPSSNHYPLFLFDNCDSLALWEWERQRDWDPGWWWWIVIKRVSWTSIVCQRHRTAGSLLLLATY